MAKIRNPIQFSSYFKIDPSKLTSLGAFDPTLNVDAKLFIDPLLLSRSKHPEMRTAEKTYKTFFSGIIKLLEVSTIPNDLPWRTAFRKLLFREIKGTCLGYGAASICGSGFGQKLTAQITGIRGKKRKEYFAAVQAGLDCDYEPMKKVFRSVLSRTRRTHPQHLWPF